MATLKIHSFTNAAENRPDVNVIEDQMTNENEIDKVSANIIHRRIDDLELGIRDQISSILKLSAISDRQDQHNPPELPSEYTSLLVKQNESLVDENLKIKGENEVLKDRLNVMTLALSDLQNKLEDYKNEKLSLVTAFKIMQDQHKDQLKLAVGNSNHSNVSKVLIVLDEEDSIAPDETAIIAMGTEKSSITPHTAS